MKIYNYKPDRSKPINKECITHHPLGHESEIVLLDRKESDGFTSEGVLCNRVFVGMCTTSFAYHIPSDEILPVRWSMVFNGLNRKDLKRIGNRFKYCAPLIMLPYIQSTDMPIEDWPALFQSKTLTCDLFEAKEQGFERVEVRNYNGKLHHERLFME